MPCSSQAVIGLAMDGAMVRQDIGRGRMRLRGPSVLPLGGSCGGAVDQRLGGSQGRWEGKGREGKGREARDLT